MNTPVHKLRPLAVLMNLQYLDIEHTQARDIAPRANLTSLEDLDITNTLVSKLKRVETFTQPPNKRRAAQACYGEGLSPPHNCETCSKGSSKLRKTIPAIRDLSCVWCSGPNLHTKQRNAPNHRTHTYSTTAAIAAAISSMLRDETKPILRMNQRVSIPRIRNVSTTESLLRPFCLFGTSCTCQMLLAY